MAGKKPGGAPQANDWIGGGRAVLRGIPIGGEFLDEGLAMADATFGGDRSKSWGERWSRAVDEQRAYDAAFDRDHPLVSVGLRTAGNFALPGSAVLGAVPKAAQLLRMAGQVPRGGKLARTMGEEMVKGAAEGLADGFMAGKGGLQERAGNAAIEVVRGGAWGGLYPLLGKGLGKEVADGTDLRRGLKAQQRVGILGKLEAGGPILGLLPLPMQAPTGSTDRRPRAFL